jgi:hypothetical protein
MRVDQAGHDYPAAGIPDSLIGISPAEFFRRPHSLDPSFPDQHRTVFNDPQLSQPVSPLGAALHGQQLRGRMNNHNLASFLVLIPITEIVTSLPGNQSRVHRPDAVGFF